MMSLLSFGIEMVVCFVLLDFALQQRWARWAVVSAAMGTATLLHFAAQRRARKQQELKQGAYGKVVVFKASLLEQLTYPSEVVAMLRCRFGAISSKSAGLDHGLEALRLQPEDVDFCDIKLRQVSRSFAQVITFLPNSPESPLRLAVAVFYLVLRALDTIEDDMDLQRFDDYVRQEDKVGVQDARLAAKQRLLRTFAQRIADAAKGVRTADTEERLLGFGEGSEKELVENLDALVRVTARIPEKLQQVILSITEEMGEGMADYIARDLKNGTTDDEDFARYCHVAAGTVGDGLSRLFAVSGYAPPDLVQRRDLWDSMGGFLQRTNIIRDYLEDLVDGRAWWPKSVWGRYIGETGPQGLAALADEESIQSGRSLHCLDHMIADALELVPSCIEYLEALSEPSVYSFCALPQVMAIATLAACFANPKVFRGVVKIRKGQAARIMLDLAPGPSNPLATMRARTLAWFARFVLDIQRKAAASEQARTHQSVRVEQLCAKVQALLASKASPPAASAPKGASGRVATRRRAD